jgi:hypothetical protein
LIDVTICDVFVDLSSVMNVVRTTGTSTLLGIRPIAGNVRIMAKHYFHM